MARKTKAEAEKTRLRILRAALTLFVEKGYERTTFPDVARHIGLTKGAVYWHFKNKPDLLAELVVFMTERHTAQLARVLSHPATLDSLEALTDYFVRRACLIVDSPTNRRFFLMVRRLDWSSSQFVPVHQRIRRVSTMPYAIVFSALEGMRRTGVIRRDTDLAAVSSVVMVIWLGLLEHALTRCLETDLERALRLGLQAVFNGVKSNV
ncbi:MAG: TetR family transcriptional regulator [Kiritimatiellae bacterium]|nr:TetR family transcriptional regulator [Kiritimatiellia bacterium]